MTTPLSPAAPFSNFPTNNRKQIMFALIIGLLVGQYVGWGREKVISCFVAVDEPIKFITIPPPDSIEPLPQLNLIGNE